MRTTLRILQISMVVLGLALLAVPAHSQIVVKLGTIAPERSIWHDALLRIRQDWRDISNGQVELRIYAGGVLGGEDEMVRKMQRRALDAVAISGSGLPLVDEVVSCLDIPLLFDSYEQLDRVRSAVSGDIESRLEQRGYKVLGWTEGGWVRFFSKAPVRVPDDLRKQRLWISTGSPENEKLLTDYGFRVVALPVTDMLTGLQTGLIEAIDVPPLFALVDGSFQEAKYMLELDFAPLNSAIVMSLNVWNRIPQTFRDPFLASVASATVELRAGLRQSEREAVDEMVARGLEVVKPDAAAVAEWQSLIVSGYDRLQCAADHPDLFQRILRLQREDAAATH